MKHVLVAICVFQLGVAGCGLRLDKMTDAQKAERLATERGGLLDEIDPVDKTKSHIVISRILLDFAASSVRDGDIDGMRVRLSQYVSAIQSARDTIIGSDRNAERQPSGFKDLEIVLREQIRMLQDMGRNVSFDQRDPIDEALEVATLVREEVFQLIFPQSPPDAIPNS